MKVQLLFTLALLLSSISQARDLTPDIQEHTLDNGLVIYTLEDHSAPLFTFQLWVKVGSSDEWQGQPGVTGLSHFFEHMMFRGTPKYPKYFSALRRRGGKLNAFTWLDVTVYWEKLAKEHLEFVLDLESDRFKHMKVDFLNLEPEREVVKSERLMRTENNPSGALRERTSANLITKHSYHWPTVGWMRDLNAITLEQAQAYHQRFYVPNNCFLVLVGDFRTKEAVSLIEKYFGGLKKRPVKREPRIKEPEQQGEKRVFVEKPTGAGLFQIMYHAPAGKDPDYPTMAVIDALLTGTKSSRLQQALVHGKNPIAKDVSSFAFPFADPSAFSIEVEMLAGKSSRVAEERVSQEIAQLLTERVSAKELKRAVAQLRGSIVRQMTTSHSRAQMIGFSVRATGDPRGPWKMLKAYGDVTPEDIQRVAKQRLVPNKRVIGHAVDPRNIVNFSKAAIKQWPSKNAKIDTLLLATLTAAGKKHEWNKNKSALELEESAIKLLTERANKERSRLVRSEKSTDALEKYLTTSAQGTTKRLEKLAKKQAGHAKTGKEITKALKQATTMRANVGDTSDPNDQRRLAWVDALLGDESVDTPAPESNERAVTDWALRQLSIRHFKKFNLTNPIDSLAKLDSEKPFLKGILDFAHTSQEYCGGKGGGK